MNKKNELMKKIKKDIVLVSIIVAIIGCGFFTLIAKNIEKNSIETSKTEKNETILRQEEKTKALTEITARTPNTDNFTYVISEDEIQVPVPKGYVASTDAEERYVNGITAEDGTREHHGGFVIYEKNAGETDDQARTSIAEDLDIAQRTRNQWVWVPIDAVIDMYYVTNAGIIYANEYTFSSSSYSKSLSLTTEPTLVSNYDNDKIYLKQYLEGINRNNFLQEMREEFNEMLKSVATYRGFYIGRYETGNISSKVPVVRKENSTISNVNWYLMYKRCKNLKGGWNSAKTGMIWGIQWDETLKWIIETGDKTNEEIGSYIVSLGNYDTDLKETTGLSEDYKMNNVYDMAGNVWEWRLESYGSNFRYFRGGGYNKNYVDRVPVSSRSTEWRHYYKSGTSYKMQSYNAEPYQNYDCVGCRATLYIL